MAVFGSALLLSGTGAGARTLRYRPRPDDTLSHVALVHYGNPKKYVYLMQVNGISDPDRLPSGRTLRIPTVGRYRVKKGDTLGKIAARFLRSSKRADFLTWLNRIKDPARLEPGTVITIPFLIRHRAQQGQTMVDVARRYYFTSRSTGLLRRFNGRKTNALREGEIIWVPIFDPDAFHEKVLKRRKAFEKRQKKLKEQARHIAKRAVVDRNGSGSSNAANDRDSKVKNGAEPGNKRSRAASVIERAFKLYREGEYQLALAILKEHVERQDVKPAEEARAREIMAYCLVALDRPREAEHEFVRLLMVAPGKKLDPVTTSPKILKIFKRARGAP